MREAKEALKTLLAWRQAEEPSTDLTDELAYRLEALVLAVASRDIDVACMYDDYQLLVDGLDTRDDDEED